MKIILSLSILRAFTSQVFPARKEVFIMPMLNANVFLNTLS